MKIRNLEFVDLPEHEILENGIIRSINRVVDTKSGKRVLKSRVMSSKPGIQGYPHVTIRYNNLFKGFSLHRLLALAFIDNPDNLPCVNHKDGNKLNYSLDNLEWCTHVKNIRHAYKNGLMVTAKGSDNPSSKLDRDKVNQILDIVKNTEKSYKVIGEEFGVSASCIGDIIKGKVWNNNKFSIQDLKDYINSNSIVTTEELINKLEKCYE